MPRSFCKNASGRWLCGAALCLTAVLTAGALALYARAGGSAAAALGVWAAAALAVALPGAALARLAAPHAGAGLRIPLACTLGALGFALTTAAASALQLHALVWAWVLGGAVLAAWLRRRAGRSAAAPRFCTPADAAALAPLWGAAVLGNAVYALRCGHPAALGSLIPQQDFYWNLGNVESFFYGFPPADLRVAGVTLTYHYLTELLEAGLCFLTGAPAFDVTAFYAYAPLCAAMLACLYCLGRRLWDAAPAAWHGRAAALASMPFWLCCASLWKALSGASRFGNSLLTATLSNANGQTTAFAFLAAFFVFFAAFAARLNGEDAARPLAVPAGKAAAAPRAAGPGAAPAPRAARAQTAGLLAACAAAFYLLAFAKGPEAGLLACALAAALALTALRRGAARGWLAAAALVLPGGFAVLYRFYFAAGAASSMAFAPTGTLREYYFGSILAALQIRFPALWGAFVPALALAHAFLMAPAAFAAWALCALRDVRRLGALPPLRLVLHALAAGGMLAYFLFDHYSYSQVYFAYLALFAMGVLLLDMLPAPAGRGARPRPRVLAAWALLAVQGATMLCLLAGTARTGAALLRGGGVPADTLKCPLTAQEEQGCLWLRANMAPGELFATNRMHTGAAVQEGLSNVYTGLSGRRAYLESFKYAVSNMGARAGDVMTRYAQMEELFSPDTSPERVRALCAECHITWLLYCPGEPGSDVQFAALEKVYTSDSLVIYHVS